jgi:hypothetical protein
MLGHVSFLAPFIQHDSEQRALRLDARGTRGKGGVLGWCFLLSQYYNVQQQVRDSRVASRGWDRRDRPLAAVLHSQCRGAASAERRGAGVHAHRQGRSTNSPLRGLLRPWEALTRPQLYARRPHTPLGGTPPPLPRLSTRGLPFATRRHSPCQALRRSCRHSLLPDPACTLRPF